MQLNKSASQKTLPGARRNSRFTRFFAPLFSLVVFCCVSSANAANWACTQDMTPVSLSLKPADNATFSSVMKYVFSSGTELTIPKSYIIDPDQWLGGTQQFVVLGIDASDMSPLCKNHSLKPNAYFPNALPTPDTAHEDAVWVIVRPTNLPKGANPVVRGIEDDIKTHTILLNENDNGFYVHKRLMDEHHEGNMSPMIFLLPHDKNLQNKVHINCSGPIIQEPPYKIKTCSVVTYVEPVSLQYKIDVVWLKDFKELDDNIRRISKQFLKQ